MQDSTSRFAPIMGTLLVLASLGCLIPGPGFGPDYDGDHISENYDEEERRDEFEQPAYDPQHHKERDNPQSGSYKGKFQLDFSGEAELSLNSEKLGESTYSNDPESGACTITLADRTPDHRGVQGYMILQYLGAGCPDPGEYRITDLETAQESPSNSLYMKSLQVDLETDTAATYTSYTNASGTVQITISTARSMQGRMSVDFDSKFIDADPESSANLHIEGSFEAIYDPK